MRIEFSCLDQLYIYPETELELLALKALITLDIGQDGLDVMDTLDDACMILNFFDANADTEATNDNE